MTSRAIRRWSAFFLLALVVGVVGFKSTAIVASLGLGNLAFQSEFASAKRHSDANKLLEQAQNYLENGPVNLAFDSLEKAVALVPEESAIHHSLANALFAYRRDAMSFYGLGEDQIFDSAINHFEKAMECDPENHELAKEIATTYFGLHPIRYEATRDAWIRAGELCYTELEIQEVYLNLARLEVMAGHMDSARSYIAKVTEPDYREAKDNIQRQFVRRSDPAVQGFRYE